jgi:hypothetical protein
MDHRQQGMEGGIELLPGNGRQNDPADAGGYNVVRRRKRTAAVHGNFVPPRRQAGGELLGKCFKTTIPCRNTPGPQDSDFHLRFQTGPDLCESARRPTVYYVASKLVSFVNT